MKNGLLILIIIMLIILSNQKDNIITQQAIQSNGCIADYNILEKGICYDGKSYSDMCRIDGQNILYEFSCSQNKCISTIVNCEEYDGICRDGKCVKE